MSVFETEEYRSWRYQRLDALDAVLGPGWLAGRDLLELGAGGGELSVMLTERGAQVVAIEGRRDHYGTLAGRHGVTAIFHDLDRGIGLTQSFDIVLNFGVLYHLVDARRNIREGCALVKEDGLLILETEVMDSPSPDASVSHNESLSKEDDGMGPTGERLSWAAVEAELTVCGMDWERVDVPDRENSRHSYRWESTGDERAPTHRRRMWVARHHSPSPRS